MTTTIAEPERAYVEKVNEACQRNLGQDLSPLALRNALFDSYQQILRAYSLLQSYCCDIHDRCDEEGFDLAGARAALVEILEVMLRAGKLFRSAHRNADQEDQLDLELAKFDEPEAWACKFLKSYEEEAALKADPELDARIQERLKNVSKAVGKVFEL